MARNPALAELDSKANVGQAKRDLVLRFVRDQESLQTSQVDLKLVDDSTIDLIDSTINDEDANNDVVSGIRLDDGQPLAPRPPSGRPRSRRIQTSSRDVSRSIHKLSLSRVQSTGGKLTSSDNAEKICRSLTTNTSIMDKFTRPMSPPPAETTSLNSSWPEQDFLSRKMSSRKYLLCSPDKRLDDTEHRPFSSISDRQISNNEGLNSRSSSPTKRHSSRNRGRTFKNLNIEPVHPSEIPLLRGRSASSSVSGPYALVHLPPIQNTAPSM
ncbi:uncharacterized protein LOC110247244 [Exaiptasia diaphana]|uniref:Uncharacterized protein n=1 Tax=Exaiptasia diaphana TaxID=2652724 RepID=A0A913XT60_EXADI|nr:uncharacterized protein LOC110247244 [Exaiptasia diaphana]KXJ24686.1 hypothetical protein AC249_AIPGENE20991 [Exaiptasia diaphana]